MDLKLWKLALVVVFAGAIGGGVMFLASRGFVAATNQPAANPPVAVAPPPASDGPPSAPVSVTDNPPPPATPAFTEPAPPVASPAPAEPPAPAAPAPAFVGPFPVIDPGRVPAAGGLTIPDMTTTTGTIAGAPAAKGMLPAPSEAGAPVDKGMGGETTVAVGRGQTAGASPYHTVHVLSVGVNIALPGVGGQLEFAVNDAEAVARVFQERFGFDHVTVLRNEGATRDAIFATLERIRGELARGNGTDDFIFFFSGHGFTKTETVIKDGREMPVRHGFLVPYEPSLRSETPLADWRRSGVDMKELTDRVIALPARHRLMFIDSCFSGLAFAEQAVIRRPPDEAYREVIQRPTVQVFTAGLDTELALEDRALGHGVFTHALLRQVEASGIRTTEEIFLPLRATVRDEVSRFDGASMTPQHRYLKHAEGTFVFVPRDRTNEWADSRPDDAQFREAGSKGFFVPVKAEEVKEVDRIATTSGGRNLQADDAWRERVERYEARAAMGDPYAMTALARMYEAGVGAEPDKERAKLWADESREMFQFSASLGIKDPEVAKMVDSILNNDELIAAVVGEEKVEETKKNLQKAAELFQKLRGMFGGDGGKATVDAIEKQRLSIVRDLQESSRNRNARDRLNRMEENFRKLSAEYGPEAKPREFDDVTALMTRARTNIDLGVQPPAIRALEEVGTLLQAIKAQAPESTESKKRP